MTENGAQNELTDTQERMLRVLQNSPLLGAPVGLSDLSSREFDDLIGRNFVAVAWVDIGSIRATITEAGFLALSRAGVAPIRASLTPSLQQAGADSEQAASLAELLAGRDKFIVDHDLWPTFVASLDRYGKGGSSIAEKTTPATDREGLSLNFPRDESALNRALPEERQRSKGRGPNG